MIWELEQQQKKSIKTCMKDFANQVYLSTDVIFQITVAPVLVDTLNRGQPL